MRFTNNRRVIAAAIVVTALGSVVGVAAANSEAATIPHGAIVVSAKTGAYATARNYSSDAEAISEAKAVCGQADCGMVVTFSGRGACGAMAKRTTGGPRTPWTVEYYGAWGPTRWDAEINARRRAGDGTVIVSLCNN